METGRFYFVSDSFYERFKECGLVDNKAEEHNRPCCYMFKFNNLPDDEIYWMIPISSKIEKYQEEYRKSYKKYGMCDNISFGFVIGNKSAFLIQNLFPVTRQYILNEYIDINTKQPITIPKKLMAELHKKARKKIRYNQQGKQLGLSDTMKIYQELMKDVNSH